MPNRKLWTAIAIVLFFSLSLFSYAREIEPIDDGTDKPIIDDDNKGETPLSTPIITLNGRNVVTIEYGNRYVELGARATDSKDGDLTSKIVRTSNVNTNILGNYTVTYRVTNSDGNTARVSRRVIVRDIVPPTIILNGDANITLEAGKPYVELGATANDNYSGSLTPVITGTVKNDVLETFVLVYTATDSSGNSASVTRTIKVVDTTAPVITLNGNNPFILEAGGEFTEPGAIVTDNLDKDLKAVIAGSVNYNVVGEYPITYNATDSSGNKAAEVTRIVKVVDTTNPEIVFDVKYADGITLEVDKDKFSFHYKYEVPSDLFTVIDASPYTVKVTNNVLEYWVGDYEIKVKVTDDSGNVSKGTIPVHVVDTTKPVLHLIGDETVYVEAGSSVFMYNKMDWAYATDNDFYHVIFPINVVKTGDYILNKVPGTYVQYYNATDHSGNKAEEITKTFIVRDTIDPYIKINRSYRNGITYEVNKNAGSYIVPSNLYICEEVTDCVNESVTNNVDLTRVGTYNIHIYVEDTSGNSSEKDVTVKVVDTTKPVITLNGSSTTSLEAGNPYIELGANVTDNSRDVIEPVITGSVNNLVPGVYKIYYNAKDKAGNSADQKIRTITVLDTINPIINIGLKYQDGIRLLVDKNDTTPYVVPSDLYTVTEATSYSVIVTNNVKKNVLGTYAINISVTDAGGHTVTATVPVEVYDNIKPIINVNGDNPKYLEAGTPYIDAGATVTDNYDDDRQIAGTGTVVVTVPGTYVISYDTKDSSNNVADTKTRTIIVTDTIKPVIVVDKKYEDGITYEVDKNAGEYVVPSDLYTCIDVTPCTPTITHTVDLTRVGMYKITIFVVDTAGNSATTDVAVKVQDTTKPVITLIGNATINLEAGATYTEQGATVTDNSRDVIEPVITGTVPTNVPNTYFIYYNASDLIGNAADQVTRTIIVTDTTKPVIVVDKKYEDGITYEVDKNAGEYVVPSDLYTCIDVTPCTPTITHTVDLTRVGMYKITIFVVDTAGNSATTDVAVKVQDTTAPIITANGISHTIQAGDTYTELGATVTDNSRDIITATVTGTVNNLVPGAYTITYTAKDSSNNIATPVSIIITVIDNVKPVINIGLDYQDGIKLLVDKNDTTPYVVPSDLFTVTEITSYTEEVTNDVKKNVVGFYSIIIKITDAGGNIATATVPVEVYDNIKPLITLNGITPVYVEFGNSYVDAGATFTDNYDPTRQIAGVGTVDVNTLGTYTITYNATDSSNNVAEEVTRTVIVRDINAPTIEFDPNGSSTVNTPSTNVTVSDIGTGVKASSLKYLWTQSTVAPISSDWTSGLVFTNGTAINAPMGALGTYYLWIYAEDNANNITINRSNSFLYDQIKPTITFTPNSDLTYKKNNSSVITVTDDNIDNTSLKYQWTNSSETPTTGYDNSFVNGASVNISAVTGDYYLHAYAKDLAGNEKYATSGVFKLDNLAPVFDSEIEDIYIITGKTLVVPTATATDLHSGMKAVTYSWSPSALPVSPNILAYANIGIYYLTYTAEDNAGNTANQEVMVTVSDGQVLPMTLDFMSDETKDNDEEKEFSAKEFQKDYPGFSEIRTMHIIDGRDYTFANSTSIYIEIVGNPQVKYAFLDSNGDIIAPTSGIPETLETGTLTVPSGTVALDITFLGWGNLVIKSFIVNQ